MVFKMHTLSLPRTKEDLFHGSTLKRFSWRELKLATHNFSKKNVVGRGGFGSIYRGRLGDGSLVAVKRCTDMSNTEVEPQFQSEAEFGGSRASDHPNILRLVGYCMTKKERILVYPLLVNRSVHSWLHDRLPSDPPLDWPTRKQIALGAAKGLAHLHYGCAFTVIHRDVKSSNILLDDQFEAVFCDFGLVKFIGRKENESNSNWVQRPMEALYDDEDTFEEDEEEESDHDNNGFTKSCWNFTRTLILRPEDAKELRGHTKWSCWAFTKSEVISESAPNNISTALPTYHEFCTHVTTGVRGTFGYLDPEYFRTNKCTVKVDVYGYGVTLLELVSGQRALDSNRAHDANILSWADRLSREGELDMLVDSNLRRDYTEETKQLIQLALRCTREEPKERPIMSEVINIIENIGRTNQLSGAKEDLLQRFTLPQLKLATYNFSSKNIIGKSGISISYRGLLKEDGSTVVVKRLAKRSKRGMTQFQAAVKLGGIRHPNLLQLRGYCISGKESLLVYPFMPNRSLEWLLRPDSGLALDWHARKKIALGVAKGIAYLHYDCESNASIRRNVKPYNILLDGVFNPVLCNLSLQSQGGGLTDAVSCADDVHGYGITIFVLISGKVSTAVMDRDSFYTASSLHYWFKKLRHHQLELLLDPRMHIGDDIKDEIEQLIQVALLCTQPSPKDRPEMWQVMQMLQGISEGDLKVCFAFDRANMFRFDESLQHQLVHEVEIGDTIDSPKLDSEGSVSSESDHTNEIQLSLNPKQDSNISSKGKEVVESCSVKPTYGSKALHTKSRSRYKGITISDNVFESKTQEIWKIFFSEIMSDALPTKSKLCKSGTSVDLLCPMCNEYEEDSFHIFFNCDFSRQAWLLAVGVRIDMLGFGSVKEAVDLILKPSGAGLNILPPDVEPSIFSHKGVALMHSIWTHRNQVCSDNVSPNVIQMLKDLPDATHRLYSIQPPTATQLIQESETATQQEFEAGSDADESSHQILANYVRFKPSQECDIVDSDLAKYVECESCQEIKLAQLELEETLIPQFIANCEEIEQTHLQPEVLFPEVLANCVMRQSSQKTKPGKPQPEKVLNKEVSLTQPQPEQLLLPKVLEAGINSNQKHYLQVNIITSGDLLFSFKFNKPSV